MTDRSTATGDLALADVEAVHWDVETLLPQPGDAGVDQLLGEVEALVVAIEAYRGRLATLDAAGLADLMGLAGQVAELLGRAGNYSSLRFCVDTADPAIAALMQRVEERGAQLSTRMVFVELEWAALDDEHAERLASAPELAFCAHHLRSARRYRSHLLSEPEEVILTEKSVTGASSWERLYNELSSEISVALDGRDLPLDVALAQLDSPDPRQRRTIAESVTGSLQPGLRTRAFIYNTLMADKAVNDRLRKYETWISSRNLGNETSDESVQALMDAVAGRYDIPRRWYEAKARILGLDRLDDWDRYASVSSEQGAAIAWPEAVELVLDAYGSFSGEMADVVRQFVSNPWIDAPPGPHKRGGAFCAYTVPSHHPYLLLNWSSKRRDVLTLAHELGHGIHAYLSRGQGVFHQSTPLTLAETASVFGETVTFGRLLENVTDPSERLDLLASDLEGQLATVFRQVSMCRFEAVVHTERREVGELSIDRFGELWHETQSAMFEGSVRLSDGYRSWWSYIPHFIHTPGYVYAYAYGQLLALSVYAQYEAQGAAFVPSYLELLRSGGSRSPEELAAIVGCDLADPRFWDAGLDIIEGRLDAALAAASAAGRL